MYPLPTPCQFLSLIPQHIVAYPLSIPFLFLQTMSNNPTEPTEPTEPTDPAVMLLAADDVQVQPGADSTQP